MLPSPYRRGLGLRIVLCRGQFWVHLRCGPVTRSPSHGWLCQSASEHLVSLLSATQATGLLTVALAGLSPAECASLRLDALLYECSTPRQGACEVVRQAIPCLVEDTYRIRHLGLRMRFAAVRGCRDFHPDDEYSNKTAKSC
jgi:hypothetical protein